MKKQEWFETWFDTPYYKMLYQHHDEREAREFVDALLAGLHLPAQAEVLDAGCGTGRYSTLLADKGFHVTGIDLSFDNIEHASVNESDQLTFHRHDMREIFFVNYFDAIFSFFTSFGYFKTDREDLKAMRALSQALKPGGKLVIDFFNARKMAASLPQHHVVAKNGILFSIDKMMEGNVIVKEIYFQDQGREFQFEERVRALTLEDFRKWFELHRLKLQDVFGDYQLHPFDEETSERMIMVAEKI